MLKTSSTQRKVCQLYLYLYGYCPTMPMTSALDFKKLGT